MTPRVFFSCCLLLLCSSIAVQAQSNFPDRRAIIVNNCPHVELSDFKYGNKTPFSSTVTRFEQDLKWKNVSTQPIVAFEIVILKYDPFDRRLIGSRWLVGGRNSANLTPLPPGASSGDGTISYRDEDVFTAIAYIRHVRLQDGTIWTADDEQLLAAVRAAAPFLKEFGDLKPDAKPPQPERPPAAS
jgi:hypothetical protein